MLIFLEINIEQGVKMDKFYCDWWWKRMFMLCMNLYYCICSIGNNFVIIQDLSLLSKDSTRVSTWTSCLTIFLNVRHSLLRQKWSATLFVRNFTCIMKCILDSKTPHSSPMRMGYGTSCVRPDSWTWRRHVTLLAVTSTTDLVPYI